MKLDFDIYDEIVDDGVWGGLSSQTFVNAIKDLKEGDELDLHFNSPGGSVVAGIAMANKVKELSKKGVKTTAIVEGICASIATVIMCACEKVKMNKSAFCMIHNCWAVVQGDADELRKQADVMEKMNEAILSFYRSKFDLTDDELKAYMDEETWFSGSEAQNFKFNCEVIDDEDVKLQLAAKFDLTKFHKIPEALNMTSNEEIVKAEEKPVEEEVVDVSAKAETKEEPSEEKEEKKEEKEEISEPDEEEEKKPTYEELESRISELVKENEDLKKQLAECGGGEKKKDSANEETVTKAECEKRVSGMQASMQKQINDFQNQLMAKNEELTKAKAEITSLKDSLEKTSEELSKVASALEEKNKALEMLNSNVNAKSEEEIPTMAEGLAKCASPAEKVAFLKSGRYVR